MTSHPHSINQQHPANSLEVGSLIPGRENWICEKRIAVAAGWSTWRVDDLELRRSLVLTTFHGPAGVDAVLRIQAAIDSGAGNRWLRRTLVDADPLGEIPFVAFHTGSRRPDAWTGGALLRLAYPAVVAPEPPPQKPTRWFVARPVVVIATTLVLVGTTILLLGYAIGSHMVQQIEEARENFSQRTLLAQQEREAERERYYSRMEELRRERDRRQEADRFNSWSPDRPDRPRTTVRSRSPRKNRPIANWATPEVPKEYRLHVHRLPLESRRYWYDEMTVYERRQLLLSGRTHREMSAVIRQDIKRDEQRDRDRHRQPEVSRNPDPQPYRAPRPPASDLAPEEQLARLHEHLGEAYVAGLREQDGYLYAQLRTLRGEHIPAFAELSVTERERLLIYPASMRNGILDRAVEGELRPNENWRD